MTRTAGRLTVVLLLAVFILLALLLRTQGRASASAPAQLAPPDQREAVSLNPAQADHVLTEMRGLLASIRDIHSAMAVDDWGRSAPQRRRKGPDAGNDRPRACVSGSRPAFAR